MELLRSILFFIFGTCLASFRFCMCQCLLKKESCWRKRSHCDHCKHTLTYHDLIPIFSYILLKGKCRYCHQPIARSHLVLEASIGCLSVCLAILCRNVELYLIALLFSIELIMIAYIDAKTMRIYTMDLFYLQCFSCYYQLRYGSLCSWAQMIAMLSIPSFLSLLNLFQPQSFGTGDILLCAVFGYLLGMKQASIAFLLALCSASSYGILCMWKKKLHRKSHIPFAPFLCFGCILISIPLFINS